MRLLIMGGTWFLGRTLAEQGLSRGWSVTTFTRGRSGRAVDGARAVHGDRTDPADIARLAASGRWDAVVDTSGQEPASVLLAARALRAVAPRYVYVSTVNAYRGWPAEPLTDDSAVLESNPALETDNEAATQGLTSAAEYGILKSGCEQAAIRTYGADQSLVLRPGVILGPYEYVGRLPWLLRRMDRGGRVLAAGDPQRPIQPLDVRDLAAFILDAIESGLAGAMNATAPLGHSTYGELLAACRDVTGGAAELTWVDDDWLSEQDVTPWSEVPLWRTMAGAWAVSSARAEAAGLRARPLAETVTDTWAWLQREELMPHGRQNQIGLDPAKEAALLSAWDQRAAQAS